MWNGDTALAVVNEIVSGELLATNENGETRSLEPGSKMSVMARLR